MNILAINERALKPHAELINDFKAELNKVLEMGQINYKPIDILLYDDTLILSINGAFAYKPDELEKIFLGTIDYQDVIDTIEEYKSGMENVILNINSSGGTVQGIKLLSDYIQSLDIPTIAYTDNYLYSAGYWIASSCDKFYAHAEASTGSIGVIAMHEEYSKSIKGAGVEQTIFRAGSRKAKPNRFEPLDTIDRAEIQNSVDESYQDFLNHVSSNRGLSLDNAEQWADGRVFNADKALELELIDGIVKSLDDVIGLVNQIDDDMQVLDKADGQSASLLLKNEEYNTDMTTDNMISQSDFESLKASLEAIKADNETIKQSNDDLKKENEELKSKLSEAEKAPLLAVFPESERGILAGLDIDSLKGLVSARAIQAPEAEEKEAVMHIAGSVKHLGSAIVDGGEKPFEHYQNKSKNILGGVQ